MGTDTPPHALSLKVILPWLAMLPILALIYMTVPPSPDQSQFDWMAYIATQGRPVYSGSFDMNWPGAMWLHEAGLRLFGIHAWTWRLTDFLLMTGFTLGGMVFLSRAGWRLAPTLFLFLYPPLYITSGAWMAGQRDIMATGFLILACAMAMPGRGKEWIAVFAAGVCVSAAVLIRPTFLSYIVGLILLEAVPLKVPQERRLTRGGRVLGFGLGCAFGLFVAAFAALLMGNLDDWYQQSFEFAFSIYVDSAPQDWRITLQTLFIDSWHWITLLGVIGFLFWAGRDRFGYALTLVLGIAATLAVSFTVQNKYFEYHLGGILPVLILLTAVALDSVNNLRLTGSSGLNRRSSLLVLVLFGLLVVAGTASKLQNFSDNIRALAGGNIWPTEGFELTETERQEIVTLISEGSTEEETIALYGTQYELPYRAERLPAYRYFTPAADQISPNFAHYEAWMAEVDIALANNPPAFIIMQKRLLENYHSDTDRPILHRLITHVSTDHVVVFENKSLIVYQRHS